MAQWHTEFNMNFRRLTVYHSVFIRLHHLLRDYRRDDTSFGIILKGSVSIKSPGSDEFTASEGDIIYIPGGIFCDTEWHGTPDIEYYSIHLYMDLQEFFGSYYPPQKLPPTCGAIFNDITKVFQLMSESNPSQKLRALSVLTDFFADAAAVMQTGTVRTFSPLLCTALRYIEQNYSGDFSMQQLADTCHISVSRLFHIFKDEFGSSPNSFRNKLRIERASKLLVTTDMTISQIAESVGFMSNAYFCETFKKLRWLSPAAYRKKMNGS